MTHRLGPGLATQGAGEGEKASAKEAWGGTAGPTQTELYPLGCGEGLGQEPEEAPKEDTCITCFLARECQLETGLEGMKPPRPGRTVFSPRVSSCLTCYWYRERGSQRSEWGTQGEDRASFPAPGFQPPAAQARAGCGV